MNLSLDGPSPQVTCHCISARVNWETPSIGQPHKIKRIQRELLEELCFGINKHNEGDWADTHCVCTGIGDAVDSVWYVLRPLNALVLHACELVSELHAPTALTDYVGFRSCREHVATLNLTNISSTCPAKAWCDKQHEVLHSRRMPLA